MLHDRNIVRTLGLAITKGARHVIRYLASSSLRGPSQRAVQIVELSAKSLILCPLASGPSDRLRHPVGRFVHLLCEVLYLEPKTFNSKDHQ